MQTILTEFLKRVRICEDINEPLSLERFSTFLGGLRGLQSVFADTQCQLQGHVTPSELDTLEEEVT
jgi:hypothetical protein